MKVLYPTLVAHPGIALAEQTPAFQSFACLEVNPCVVTRLASMSEATMIIQSLTATDAARYQSLRLRALREHPEAFAAAWEEEQQLSLETIATRLQQSSAERYILGAFAGEELSGLLHFRRWEGLKIRHRASIGGMYVPPAYRGRGIARGCSWKPWAEPALCMASKISFWR